LREETPPGDSSLLSVDLTVRCEYSHRGRRGATMAAANFITASSSTPTFGGSLVAGPSTPGTPNSMSSSTGHFALTTSTSLTMVRRMSLPVHSLIHFTFFLGHDLLLFSFFFFSFLFFSFLFFSFLFFLFFSFLSFF
jgi:hypothetical protein